MWVSFQYQDNRRLLQHLHPVAALVYLGVLGGLTLVFAHPLYLLGLLVVILLAIQAVDGLKGWELCLKFTLGMSLLILLINLLVVRAGETVIWWGPRLPVLGELTISVEAICYAATMCVRLLDILSVFYLFNRMLHPDQVLRLFSRFAAQSSLVLSLSTRMFPFLLREVHNLQEVLSIRGVDFRKGTGKERLQKYLSLFNLLLLNALENSLETAEAMQARAFASGPRSRYRKEVFRPRDFLCLTGSLLALCVTIYGQIYNYSTFHFYPQLGYLISNTMTLVVLGIILVLLSLPIIISWGWQHCPYFNARI